MKRIMTIHLREDDEFTAETGQMPGAKRCFWIAVHNGGPEEEVVIFLEDSHIRTIVETFRDWVIPSPEPIDPTDPPMDPEWTGDHLNMPNVPDHEPPDGRDDAY